MAKKKKNLASLAIEEDKAWQFAYNHFLDQGNKPRESDEKAWQEICQQFPRLKKFDGAMP